MPSLRDIALLEEARGARQVAGLALETRPFAGGVACYSGPGTFHNRVIGAGLNGPVADAELDELLEFYRDHRVTPSVELCPYVDSSLVTGLAPRNFVLRDFMQLLFRSLRGGEVLPEPPLGWPAKFEVREIDREDPEDVELFVRVSTSGFFSPGQTIPELVLDIARRSAVRPSTCAVVAVVEGVPAGAGSMDLGDDVAYLAGTSVLPEFRERGVQQALMLTRLARARAHGCQIATIGSRPGTSTERNGLRLGFAIAYTKSVLVRSSS